MPPPHSTGGDRSLSVVVAASNGPALLRACLASLVEQEEVSEVVVVSNFEATAAVAEFPIARHLGQPAGTTVPMLRTHGIRAASGGIVALTEDNVTFGAEWGRAHRRAHAEGHVVVGGPVEQPDGGRASDWAVYFYEYGRYMPPLPAGPAAALAGNNVSYARSVLDEISDAYAEGFYEVFVHETLRQRGHTLHVEPEAVVDHPKTYVAGEVVRQCYHHARSYAGMRVAEQSVWHRAALGAGALILPILLPGRIAVRTVRKGRRVGELARAFPYLIAFMSAWAAGEMAGYLAGPGESAKTWV
jgi:glycosyltransferase involved in cell wall biosynthesis